MQLHEQIADYLDYLKNEKHSSPQTVRAYTSDLEAFEKYIKLSGKTPFSQEGVRGFLGWLSDEGLSPATAKRRLAAVKALASFLRRRYGVSIEFRVRAPKQRKKLPKTLTEANVISILDSVSTEDVIGRRDKAILETLYASGARVAEIAGLNRTDFDPDNGTIRVMGKGSRERLVPLPEVAVDAIKTMLADHAETTGPLFRNVTDSGRLSDRSIRRTVEARAHAAGIAGKISPHGFRHACATHLLDNGADLRTVQTLLGHRSLATTQTYTSVTPRRLKKAFDDAHPLG